MQVYNYFWDKVGNKASKLANNMEKDIKHVYNGYEFVKFIHIFAFIWYNIFII